MKLFTRDRAIGTLVEASLKTERPTVKLEVGKSYSVAQLLEGNGIKKKKWSFRALVV